MTLIIAIHIWRVRKDNFAVVDRAADEPADEPVEVHDVDV
jgi:hypothetical protein